MKIEDLYRNTRIIKSVLNSQEIEELLARIKKFGEENLVVNDYVHTGTRNYDKIEYKYRNYWVNCPCGTQVLRGGYYNEIEIKEGKNINEEINRLQERAFEITLDHIIYHIRMNGSIKHIELLNKIYGNNVTKILLEHWAKKNMIVAIMLKKYIEKLEEEAITQ